VCLKSKIRMKVDNRIKDIRIVFLSCNYDLWHNIFCHEFFMFRHVHIILSFIEICIFLRCYTTSDIHMIIWTKQLKFLLNQERKDVIFSSMFLSFFSFLAKNLFWCVLIIWLHVLNDMGIYLSKEKRKK
jgi:hypothetical protein